MISDGNKSGRLMLLRKINEWEKNIVFCVVNVDPRRLSWTPAQRNRCKSGKEQPFLHMAEWTDLHRLKKLKLMLDVKETAHSFG